MKNFLLVIFGAGIIFLLPSCAAILGGSTNTHFYSQTPHATISITSSGNAWGETENHTIGQDSGVYKMKNSHTNYYVKQELDGYKSDIAPLEPTRYNLGKIVGYACALVVDIIFLEMTDGTIQVGDGNSTGVFIPTFFLAIGGWWIFPAGPKHMYEKKYSLNKLIPVPKKKEDEKNLFVDQAAVKIEGNHVRWDYYESFSDYMKGNKMYGSSSGKKVTYENTEFSTDLNKLLVKYQYCDTTKKLLANTFNSMRLRTTITGYGTTSAGNMYCIDLTTEWSLHDYYDKAEKISKEISAKSKWLNSASPSDDETHELILDALENGLITFLNDSAVTKYLKNETNQYNKTLERWEEKNIRNDATATSISEASKAVVTIKTPKGHGSGCIISKEGFVLTNYHVAGDSSSKVEILFEDGTKDSGTVIRINPLYDLALIKIKPVSMKPLKINLTKTIEVGTEVFAIGTPEDVDLGQTVTKGIISGKRKVDEKVYIQTDVSISPGNSGGALITKDGLVVGIINAKIIGRGIEGIGFAIPAYYISEAMKIKFVE